MSTGTGLLESCLGILILQQHKDKSMILLLLTVALTVLATFLMIRRHSILGTVLLFLAILSGLNWFWQGAEIMEDPKNSDTSVSEFATPTAR